MTRMNAQPYYEEVNGLTLIDNPIVQDETETVIEIPYKYKPYPFQKKAWKAKKEGYRNFIFLWHRRAGKDKTLWNMFIDFIIEEWDTPGTYLYCLPTASQAKKVLWECIGMLDHIPKELISRITNNDMRIELINGSSIQVVGSDNYNRLVGTGPNGMCFSEYSISDPRGYEYMSPAIARNKGWTLFPYTPRGKNHGYDLIENAKKSNVARQEKGLKPLWYIQIETVDTTTDHNGDPLFDDEAMDENRIKHSEDFIQQEYYCSFDAAIPGAIYGDQMRAVRNEDRIRFLPIDKSLPMFVSADIGLSDACCWWFFQLRLEEIRLVHYYENAGQDIEHYINYVTEFKNTKGVNIQTVILPHDGNHKTVNAPLSVQGKFKAAGHSVEIAPGPFKVNVNDGIQQVRKLFPRFIFAETETEIGINALTSYQRKWDDVNKIYSTTPLHDWASNGADAMRMFAVWYNEKRPQNKPKRSVPRKATGGKYRR